MNDFVGAATASVASLLRAWRTDPAQFDPWRNYRHAQAPRWFVCRNESYTDILPWTNDAVALKNQINAFQAGGNTSIDVAVKWGAGLLDPSMGPQLNSLLSTGQVPASFTQRPFAYNRPDTLKFIVVMTDGINTTQYYLKDAYKSGQSPIYKDTQTGRLSTDDQEFRDTDGDNDWREPNWYVPGRYWINQPYDSDGAGTASRAERLDWQDVWAEMSMSWRAYHLHYRQYYNANHYYDNLYGPRSTVSASMKDARLNQVCSAAKTQGVIVFAIGFEVTDSSAAVMRNCASTPNHFYRVDGLDIQYAFASIANQINQLKLTQ